MKVVIWGHPLGTHTHSYSNQGYYNAFKHLGHDIHWFPDEKPQRILTSLIQFLLERVIKEQKIFLLMILVHTL